MAGTTKVTLDDVEQARGRIAGVAETTRVVRSDALSGLGFPVWLKLDTEQPTGSFKIRGAANRMLRLGAAERRRGVIAASSGNHGRAVAYLAKQLGIPATVVVSGLVPVNKLDAVRELGAELVVVGESQDDAMSEMERRARRDGSTIVLPFDDADVIAGQGTIALELFEQVPDLRTIVVPLSGGGLISGIAVAAKALRADATVVGVSMERGAAMYQSLTAGRPVEVTEVETLADSLGGGIGLDNRHTFGIVRELVDEIHLVSETQIASAMRHLVEVEGVVAEGGAAVGIAALAVGLVTPPASGSVAVVVSGRNVDEAKLAEIVEADLP